MDIGRKLTVKTVIITIVAMLIITPIFVESFGSNLLYNKKYSNSSFNLDKFEAESKLIYLIASIIGQITYSLFTTLQGGFLILPAFESNIISSRIHMNCMKLNHNGFINSLSSLCLACLTVSILVFTLAYFKIGRYLKMIPFNITLTLMFKTGLDLFMFGCSYYYSEDLLKFAIFCIISIVITVVAMLILKFKKDPIYVIIYILFVTLMMNILKNIGFKRFLFENKLFIDIEPTKMSVSNFFSRIDIKAFNLKIIFSNWKDIISLAIFPVISYTVNIPAYCNCIGIPYNFDKELVAFGFMNLFSSLSFYPTYFNCSGSIFFYVCGGKTSKHSLFSGIVICILYSSIHKIIPIIPIFVVTLITQFIGISFIIDNVSMLISASMLDKSTTLILLIISYVTNGNTIIICICGLLFNYISNMIFSGKFLLKNDSIIISETSDTLLIKISNRLDFTNINMVLERLNATKKNLKIDFKDCMYIDMTANFALHASIEAAAKNGYSYCFDTTPKNFYTHLYSKIAILVSENKM